MNNSKSKTYLSGFLALFFSSTLIYCAGNNVAVGAEPADTLKSVRTIDTDDLFNEDFFKAGPPDFPGVGFPPGANTLLLLDQPQGGASVVLATPPIENIGENAKVSFLPVEIADPINIAFDSVTRDASASDQARLFLLDADELIAIKAGPQNIMIPSSIKRMNAREFGIADPQGMTLEPDTGQLFVLDGAGPRLVSIQPKQGREFAGAEVTSIILPNGLGALRGLAYNPEDKHVYAASLKQNKLYKLTVNGEVATVFELPDIETGVLQGMVFAPSLDLTDSPAVFHLYLTISRGSKGEVTEWVLPGSLSPRANFPKG